MTEMALIAIGATAGTLILCLGWMAVLVRHADRQALRAEGDADAEDAALRENVLRHMQEFAAAAERVATAANEMN